MKYSNSFRAKVLKEAETTSLSAASKKFKVSPASIVNWKKTVTKPTVLTTDKTLISNLMTENARLKVMVVDLMLARA